MENKFFKFLKFDAILDNIKGYIETRIELLKLEASEKLAHVITLIAFVFCFAFFGMLAFIFLNLALGGFLNAILESEFLGYLAVGLFYLLIMIILGFSIRKGGIHRSIRRATAKMFTGSKK